MSQEDPKQFMVNGVDIEDQMFVAKRRIQQTLDKLAFYPQRRWAALVVMLSFFFLRMYIQQGYAVIAYLLGLFYLNNIMLFLAPAEDPEDMEFNTNDSEFCLPVRENDEYKGFQRKLQEMDLWTELMGATTVAAFLSLF